MTAQVAQKHDCYTPQEHAVWAQLYTRQMQLLSECAAPELLKGRELLGMRAEMIPNFAFVTQKLHPLTNWRLVCVDGKVGNEDMFEFLARRWFPANRNMRPQENIDFSPEPDAFHDVFGHVPPLTNPIFAGYLQRYGMLGLKAKEQGKLEELTRLYFYTVEVGVIDTPQGLKVYGSALATSKECTHALAPETTYVPFDLKRVFETPIDDSGFQKQYFVIESFRQLEEAIYSPALLQ